MLLAALVAIALALGLLVGRMSAALIERSRRREERRRPPSSDVN
jgi:hypothetical protein